MGTSEKPLLHVHNLTTHFASARGTVRAVDGVSFDVKEGEAVGIVGESGSGKSMTSLSILRLVPPPGRVVAGSVEFDGRDLLALDDEGMRGVRLSDIAMIFQDAGSYLNPIMTIEEQIAESIGKRGSRKLEDRERVLDALRAVQIPDPARVAASYPFELSGGMQQRVLIAAVLIRKPRLIIADEPTTALDATVQDQILRFLAAMRVELGAALMLISHDLAVIADVCDSVYVMYAGQVVESGPTAQIFDAPKHPYTMALIDSILDPFDPKTDLVPLEGTPPNMASPPSGCRFHPRCRFRFEGCDTVEPKLHDFGNGQAAKCALYDPERVGA
ncbi:MAG TPA: ABC transporter ATP-binding protein [Devosiaceae bacterium]|jgi:oligopeptide/dipeptide ABC transporter ATP-binding protein